MHLDICLLTDNDLRDVGTFDCGVQNEPLTHYIKGAAFEDNRSGKTKTYLVKDLDKQEIAGYFSLRTSGFGYIEQGTNQINYVPAVELSEFAIHIDYQGQGLGTALFLGHIVPKVQKLAEEFGCQVILVYAWNENAIKFYQKNNFMKIEDLGAFIEAKDINKYLTITDDFSQGCNVFIYIL